MIFVTEAFDYVSSTRATPLGSVGVSAIVNEVAVYPVVAALALMLLLFPTGRPRSRVWAVVGWILVSSTTVVPLWVLIQPGETGSNERRLLRTRERRLALRCTTSGLPKN